MELCKPDYLFDDPVYLFYLPYSGIINVHDVENEVEVRRNL